MKKIIFMFSLILSFVFASNNAYAADIIISIDSNEVEYNQNTGNPYIDQNYRTQVPFRQTLEKYGATVDWNNEKRIATATKGDIKVEIPIGTNYVIKNGTKLINDTKSTIIGGRTYLPIRKVMEAFESEVEWDQELKTVVITTNPFDTKEFLLNAFEKSNAWESFNINMTLDVITYVEDERGILRPLRMSMQNYGPIFFNPIKIHTIDKLVMRYNGLPMVNETMSESYIIKAENGYDAYIKEYDENGRLTWYKTSLSDEEMAVNEYIDIEYLKNNIKEAKYLGKKTDSNLNTSLKFEYNVSGEMLDEIFGTYMDDMTNSSTEEEALAADLIKEFIDKPMTVYIDEKTEEIVKYHMDLTDVFKEVYNSLGIYMTEEDDLMFNSMSADMTINLSDINNATDFEIPQYVIDNAKEMQ